MAETRTHSKYYKTVKRYYNKGYYDADQVAVFVRTGRIYDWEYEEITGQAYVESVEETETI